jgi:putative transcriptional regulator
MQSRRLLARFANAFMAMAALACVTPVLGAEPDEETVILVARPALRDALYGATILITKPIGNDQHIGFIVNKPTRMTLGKLFPQHGPSQKVVDPVYLGGPVSTELIFALVQRRDSPGKRAMQLLPELYLVLDRELVDHVIEAEPEHARFFAGMVLWRPGELRSELERGFWNVLDADPKLILRKPTEGMWEELVKRVDQKPKGIRTDLGAPRRYVSLH